MPLLALAVVPVLLGWRLRIDRRSLDYARRVNGVRVRVGVRIENRGTEEDPGPDEHPGAHEGVVTPEAIVMASEPAVEAAAIATPGQARNGTPKERADRHKDHNRPPFHRPPPSPIAPLDRANHPSIQLGGIKLGSTAGQDDRLLTVHPGLASGPHGFWYQLPC